MTTKVGRLVTLLAAMVMTLGLFAAPATAQDTTQQGLVNVYASDILVQVPVGIAANICPAINAAVLAQDLDQEAFGGCEAFGTGEAHWEQTRGSGDTEQSGLVNVLISDVTVQVPIGIAANICPAVNAAVLAQELTQEGFAQCDALAEAEADGPGQGQGNGRANAPGQNR